MPPLKRTAFAAAAAAAAFGVLTLKILPPLKPLWLSPQISERFEKIFGLPGLGGIAVSATSQRDITTIQGVVVYFAILAVLVNLVLDLTYRRLNPKVQVK